jgi:hypothetical protein
MDVFANIALVMYYLNDNEELPIVDRPPRPPKPRDTDIKINTDGTLPDHASESLIM